MFGLFSFLFNCLVSYSLQDGMPAIRFHVGVQAQHDIEIFQRILLLATTTRLGPAKTTEFQWQ